jgi:hypothetical protein
VGEIARAKRMSVQRHEDEKIRANPDMVCAWRNG